MGLELKVVVIDKPADVNLILGQSHFIKTVEDLYETRRLGARASSSASPSARPRARCLIRAEGNDDGLKALAVRTPRRRSARGTASSSS